MKKFNIGLLGWGTIGTGVAKLLTQNRELIQKKCGIDLNLSWIADLDITRDRGISIPKEKLTQDAMKVIRDPQVDIIVELIGGYEPATSLVKEALGQGKKVVTANKAMLAKNGQALFNESHDSSFIRFEASVAGGIPIIKSLTEGFGANQINSVYGIVNGTANYILTQMQKTGGNFQDILKEAQDLGYAEADPSFDVDGNDSRHKLVLLSSLAYSHWINEEDIFMEGIRSITSFDIREADEFGYVIKLLAISKMAHGKLQARVHPTFIPKSSPLALVDGAFNAVYIDGDFVGPSLQYGLGAGEKATASAVVADIIDAALGHRTLGLSFNDTQSLNMEPFEELECCHYLRVNAKDVTGALAKITGILSNHAISIASIEQNLVHKIKEDLSGFIPVVIMTHEVSECLMQKAQTEINQLDLTDGKSFRIRVEDI